MPTRRSTAEAFQILISHAFGDAGSPYLIGVVSIEFEFFFAFNFIIEKYQTFFSMSQISEFLKTYHPYTRTGNSSYIDHSGATASALMSTRVSELKRIQCVVYISKRTNFISDLINCRFVPQSEAESDIQQFKSLQYALFVTCFVEIIGGVFFLITSIYILDDKRKVEEAISCKFNCF